MNGTGTRHDLTFAVETDKAKIRTVMIRPATREAQREVTSLSNLEHAPKTLKGQKSET